MDEKIEGQPESATENLSENVAEVSPTEECQLPVAYCGLYCGKCRSYVQKKCEGCTAGKQFKSCKIRKCCKEHDYRTCAECTLVEIDKCKKFNNFFSGVFSFMMGSDRKANIDFIRKNGANTYNKYMKVEGLMSFRKKP